jgi:hypothetical protein
MEITMTASYVSPNHHTHVDHDAQTVHRPPMTFVPQAGPVPRLTDSSPTWTAGWVVSGLAAFLAVASLAVMGAVAFDALSQSDPAPEAAQVSAPAASPSAAAAPTDPVQPPPVVAVYPAAPGSAPIASAPRVVMIPGPAAVPAAGSDPIVTPADPVVTPPKPVTPQKPPIGIGTCDLVACPPATPAPPLGIGTCDLVACPPATSRP